MAGEHGDENTVVLIRLLGKTGKIMRECKLGIGLCLEKLSDSTIQKLLERVTKII